MESKAITLGKGIHRSPTSASEGELTECMNLIVSKNEIVNAPTLTELDMTIPGGYTLKFIHKTTEGNVYIITDGSDICYMRSDGSMGATRPMTAEEKAELYQIMVADAANAVAVQRDYVTAKRQALDNAGEVTAAEQSTFIQNMNDGLLPPYEEYLEEYTERVLPENPNAVDYQSDYMAIEGDNFASHIERYRYIYEGYTTTNMIEALCATYVAEPGNPNNGYQTIYKGDTEAEQEANRLRYEQTRSFLEANSVYAEYSEGTMYSIYRRAIADVDTLRREYNDAVAELERRQATLDEATEAYNEAIEIGKPVSNEICEDGGSVTAIGNMLIVSCADRFVYALYKDDKYIVCSDIEMADIRFRLRSELKIDKAYSCFTTSVASNSAQESTYSNVLTTRLDETSIDNKDVNVAVASGQYVRIVIRSISGRYNNAGMSVNYYSNNTQLKYQNRRGTNIPSGWQFDWYNDTNSAVDKINIANPHGAYFNDYPVQVDIYVSSQTDRVYVENTEKNYTAIMGQVFKFIGKATEDNKFVCPFFVRYAYRMIDGSYSKPSAPILMMPNSGCAPLTLVDTYNDSQSSPVQDMTMIAWLSELEYSIKDVPDDLARLGDFVQSVVIAVSAPIYICNEGNAFSEDRRDINIERKLAREINDNCFNIGVLDVSNDETAAKHITLQESDTQRGLQRTNNDTVMCVTLPTFSQEKVIENVENASTFYIIKEIKINDLVAAETYENIGIERGTLSGLLGRTRLTDETLSLRTYASKAMMAYNNRLLIGNITERLYAGYGVDKQAGVWRKDADESSAQSHVTRYGAVVEIAHNNVTYKAYRTMETVYNTEAPQLFWFFYPSSKAKSVTLYRHRSGNYSFGNNVDDLYKVQLPLKEHPYLDGAYFFGNFNEIEFTTKCDTANLTEEEDIIMGNEDAPISSIETLNKILLSKVDSPMTFEATSAENISNGSIIEFSTNTQALSQGQFGEHPIMCFTDSGIWVIPETAEGKLGYVKPCNRDVILNGTKPLQTDSAVIYATNEGVKIFDGGAPRLVSAYIDGMREDFTSNLSNLATAWNSLIKYDSKLFYELLPSCKMVYDAANALVHLYANGLTDAHYILSLTTGEWSMMQGGMPDSIVMGYPYTEIQIGIKLYEFKRSNDAATLRKGFLLTREIAFDNPLAVKMLHWVRILKKSAARTVQIAIFASNDRDNWMLVRSMRHNSYIWYRFAIFTDMTDVDAIEGLVCGTETRRTDKPR